MKNVHPRYVEKQIRRLTKKAMSGKDGLIAVSNECGGLTVKGTGEESVMQGIANALAEKYGCSFRMLVVSPPIDGLDLGLAPVPYFPEFLKKGIIKP